MPNNPSAETISKADPSVKLLDTNLLLIFGTTLMVVMGVSSISPAFPRIMEELNISRGEVGLLISSFTVPGVFFAPVLGVLADRWGRRKILIPALFLFGIAGGACAFVRDFHTILILRFCQGFGATALGTLNVTILGDLYSGKRRTVVMGYNISVLSVGLTTYPAIGGALALLGWQFPFLLPLAAIPLGILVVIFLKNPEPRNDQNLKEYLANAFQSVKSKQAAGLFSIGVISFFITYGAYLTYFSVLLDTSFGASTFTIGLIMATSSATTALMSSRMGFLLERYPEKTILTIGFSLYAMAMCMVPFIPALWGFVIPIMIYGMGTGINLPCIQSLLTALAPLEHRAAVLSIHSLVLRVGQTLGPLIMGGVMTISGFEGVFFAAAGFSILMVIIARMMIDN